MPNISRRGMLQGIIAGAALSSSSPASWSKDSTPVHRKDRIRQSVSRWCYQKIPLDELCAYSARIGLKAIDLLQPEEFEIPRRHGLICSMGYAGGGEINKGLNRVENHAKIEEAFRENIPRAAKAGVPNVITFSGNRDGMLDEEGARNTVLGLNRLKRIAEDNNVTICMELLNSKVNHKDYMCDHSSWGVDVCKRVNSPRVKLLYDIYHMQIMEGDIARTIRENLQYIAHFHTGGNPGRHEINGTQELDYHFVAQAITDAGFKGYIAHEYSPAQGNDPMKSLDEAMRICDV